MYTDSYRAELKELHTKITSMGIDPEEYNLNEDKLVRANWESDGIVELYKLFIDCVELKRNVFIFKEYLLGIDCYSALLLIRMSVNSPKTDYTKLLDYRKLPTDERWNFVRALSHKIEPKLAFGVWRHISATDIVVPIFKLLTKRGLDPYHPDFIQEVKRIRDGHYISHILMKILRRYCYVEKGFTIATAIDVLRVGAKISTYNTHKIIALGDTLARKGMSLERLLTVLNERNYEDMYAKYVEILLKDNYCEKITADPYVNEAIALSSKRVDPNTIDMIRQLRLESRHSFRLRHLITTCILRNVDITFYLQMGYSEDELVNVLEEASNSNRGKISHHIGMKIEREY